MVIGLLQQVQTLLPNKEKRRKQLAGKLEDLLPYFFKIKDIPQTQDKQLGSGLKQYKFTSTADIPFVFSSIALAVKLLKIDGHLSKAEINSFYQLFPWPDNNRQHAEECFYEAYRDTTEAAYYAQKIASHCDNDIHLMPEVLIALIRLANADAILNHNEWDFISKVADIFDVPSPSLVLLLRWCILPKHKNPYVLLGVSKNSSEKSVKMVYRKAAKACHPDTTAGQPIPREVQDILSEKFTLLAKAYETICAQHKWK